MDPVALPLHKTFVIKLLTIETGAAGCVTIAVAVDWQPFASVAVTT